MMARCVVIALLSLAPTFADRAAAQGGLQAFGANNPLANDAAADPHNPRERVLILARGGPLVVEFSFTIDGQPFRMAREKIVERMMQAITADDDGQSTWEAALRNPRFSTRSRGLNAAARKTYMSRFDTNKNGQVERQEVRGFLAGMSGGSAFSLSAGYQAASASDLRKLFDKNKDGVLVADEVADAFARLKSRDANDDDWIDASELGGATGRSALYTLARRPTSAGVANAVYLGRGTTRKMLAQVIERRYGDRAGKVTAESFANAPRLFERLDKDADGELQPAELKRLLSAPPQLKIAVAFRNTSGELTLNESAPPFAPEKKGLAAAIARAPGCSLRFEASASPALRINFEAQARSYMQRYDSDKNGYLEEKEFGSANAIKTWDGNEDGKVYPDEIVEYLRQQYLPLSTRVLLRVSTGGDLVFQALDTNGDGRLSLRESRQAEAVVKRFDKNSDGRISDKEVPETISVKISQGNAGQRNRVVVGGGAYRAGRAPRSNAAGPQWFIHMDRNGDGDITLREFLGEEAQFKQLDANGDGFIDAQEAAPLKNR